MKRLTARDYAQALAEAVTQSPPAQHHEIVQNFLSLLRRQRASHLLPRIMDHLQQADDAAAGKTRVHITSAMLMDNQVLADALEKALGAVAIEDRIDPHLIGGISLRVGDRLVDGSVRAQLHTLRTHLMTTHA